jgi:histidyl-tRNA synthetase
VDAPEERLDVVIAVENDNLVLKGAAILNALRRAGFAADAVTTGSPRKRFDKAVAKNARILFAIQLDEGNPSWTVRSKEAHADEIAPIQKIVSDIVSR